MAEMSDSDGDTPRVRIFNGARVCGNHAGFIDRLVDFTYPLIERFRTIETSGSRIEVVVTHGEYRLAFFLAAPYTKLEWRDDGAFIERARYL